MITLLVVAVCIVLFLAFPIVLPFEILGLAIYLLIKAKKVKTGKHPYYTGKDQKEP